MYKNLTITNKLITFLRIFYYVYFKLVSANKQHCLGGPPLFALSVHGYSQIYHTKEINLDEHLNYLIINYICLRKQKIIKIKFKIQP